MTEEEFTCDNCHQTFLKGWTDEEAALEMYENLGDYRGELAVVCDDCYKMILGGTK